MKDKVIDYTVQFGYTGVIIKYDMTAIMYRAFGQEGTSHNTQFQVLHNSQTMV